MNADAGPSRRITASLRRDTEDNPRGFTLSLGGETVHLEPGRSWLHTDHYKWVTRGLMEDPQSFHVHADGAVDLNGEKFLPHDPEGPTKLEHEVNKRHTVAARAPVAGGATHRAAARAPASDQIHYRVRLDYLGHLLIECEHGGERVSTGLRGLQTLVNNGLLRKPDTVHVDPLQRYLEIDGVRFDCSESGAKALEEALNTRYAPPRDRSRHAAIEIKENAASATGFDIFFVTIRAGARFEVKGHLSQEKLDILQDPAKCDLLQPGIVMRIAPPYLFIRRRRPDGGEEHLPEFPDILYRRATANQLQEVFNHPRLRRTSGQAAPAPVLGEEPLRDVVEMQVVRDPAQRMFLGLECRLARGGPPVKRALTHRNVADFQEAGTFLPHFDITLSLDNRTLSILNQETHAEEKLTISQESSDDELQRASRILTAALKPHEAVRATEPVGTDSKRAVDPEPSPQAGSSSATPFESLAGGGAKVMPRPQAVPAFAIGPRNIPPPAPRPADLLAPPALAPAETAGSLLTKSPAVPLTAPAPPPVVAAIAIDPSIVALFAETDPVRVNTAIFRSVSERLDLAVQDVLLSLPRVFEGRRFEILSFDDVRIESVFELRSKDFYGFYVSHINPERIDLVYACEGTHIEWAPDRCLLQPSAHAETVEFKGHALLGLAQDAGQCFVFVVESTYKAWVIPHEAHCVAAFARFITPAGFAAARDDYRLIWPEPSAESASAADSFS